MKTILTFVGGGERDEVILKTALAAAIPLSAHLDCLHAHVPPDQAARYAHIEFARGAAIGSALEELRAKGDTFSLLAAENVRAFCTAAGIELCDRRGDAAAVTAGFREELSNEPDRLCSHASQSDLVVIGRSRQKQGLAPDMLEHLLRNCRRPVLVAASAAPSTLTDTVLVCWKDAASTAAAVEAAAPFLARARRAVFVSVAKRDAGLSQAMIAAARQVSAVEPEVKVIAAGRRSLPDALSEVANEHAADLVVTGAYGRSRGREILFGSCTDQLLDQTDRPILLMH